MTMNRKVMTAVGLWAVACGVVGAVVYGRFALEAFVILQCALLPVSVLLGMWLHEKYGDR